MGCTLGSPGGTVLHSQQACVSLGIIELVFKHFLDPFLSGVESEEHPHCFGPWRGDLGL